jgi:hypothetical protein
MTEALRILLGAAVDYAGTFPPARLELAEAMRRYREHRSGPHAWMLGRFLLPAAKLEEFEALAPEILPPGAEPWPASLILSSAAAGEVERCRDFARRREDLVKVLSFELPPLEVERLEELRSAIPPAYDLVIEVPLGGPVKARLEAALEAGAMVKVRTGGLKSEAFPPSAELVLFLFACHRAGLPFKATAGLHHPFRSSRPLDGDAGSPLVAMHGFVNLAVLAAFIEAKRVGVPEALELLDDPSPGGFRFHDDGIEWRGRRVGLYAIERTRSYFFRSFGACSFEEPVAGLAEHGLA